MIAGEALPYEPPSFQHDVIQLDFRLHWRSKVWWVGALATLRDLESGGGATASRGSVPIAMKKHYNVLLIKFILGFQPSFFQCPMRACDAQKICIPSACFTK